VLVVGGGDVALRKISLLERTSAFDHRGGSRCRARTSGTPAASGKLTLAIREFIPADLDGVRLAIVATSRPRRESMGRELSESRNIPVNVVDDPEASRFIVPAMHRSRSRAGGGLDRRYIAGIGAPTARTARSADPRRIGELALWLKALRSASRRKLRGTEERRRFFEAIVDGPAAQRFALGDAQGARRIAQQLLATTSTAPRAAGDVTLVGAGPGDPELLTLKALRALQDADVILHDRLVAPEVLDLARRDAARICVGKAAGTAAPRKRKSTPCWSSSRIRAKRVVRLKGGDPSSSGAAGKSCRHWQKPKSISRWCRASPRPWGPPLMPAFR